MSTRIYVGNLPYSADGQQLTQLFGAYGDVVEATIVMDRDSGQSKGFGFVQMTSDDAARSAIAGLNGSALGDRTITVNEARPRPDRFASSRSDRSYGESPHRDDDSRERRW